MDKNARINEKCRPKQCILVYFTNNNKQHLSVHEQSVEIL